MVSLRQKHPYEKFPAFRCSILHLFNVPDSGVVLTVAVIVKRQTSARVIISNLNKYQAVVRRNVSVILTDFLSLSANKLHSWKKSSA